ncbi:MAG: MBL fold metallo-hydrolase [Chitinophagales bacterium]
MIQVLKFTFNPFQENTYLIYDETNECVVFDPGCQTSKEKQTLTDVIADLNLKPVILVNTHCHIDHVFGNKFMMETYGLELAIHKGELPVLQSVEMVGRMYNIPVEPSPMPSVFLEEGDELKFGNSSLQIFLTPGHSPASLSFYSAADQFVIAGDVLFREGIGRTDLPGGDFTTLIKSIKTKLFTLEDGVKIYSGHGPETTIGHEKANNVFLK